MDVHKRSLTHSRADEKEGPPPDSPVLYPNHFGFQEENDGVLPTTMPANIEKKSSPTLPRKDLKAFIVLIVLYTLQGVPVGLAFGSVPFILKSKLSYSQVGVFSLASYPYSLKLLWSPIVDAIYSRRIGRRKSWIIPVQLVSGVTLLYLGSVIDASMADSARNLVKITVCFFLLVFFCATQDIAVDGWALTVLSPESLSFASTAQTVGMNCGYFLSFTVFLALSSPEFANKYLRDVPQETGLFTLGGYLTFWGWMYIIVTAILFYIPEDPPHLARQNQVKLAAEHYKNETAHNKLSDKKRRYMKELMDVYYSMYQVLKLPNVQTFVVILLFAKLGFQVNEAATNLKLLEKGLSKEDLSITVLINFPFEMIFSYYSGRWSSGKSPLRPWLFGFAGRLLAAICAHVIILYFPNLEGRAVPFRLFILIIFQHLLNSFMSTIQFVSLCAFHTRIADPAIGGTYMTTLNTLSNYGGTWPRLIILFLIDKLTLARCEGIEQPFEIISEGQKATCTSSGGTVVFLRDGYYYTSALCITLGICIWFWVKRKARYLQSLPQSAWRVQENLK